MTTRQLALAVAAATVLVDQLTKAWAVAALDDGPVRVLGDVLRFRLTRNTGAAFSSLQGLGPLIGIAAFGVVGLIFVMLRHGSRRFEVIGLGLVLGGALGNLADRIFRGDGFLDGAVVDWVDPSFFPAFNAADSAITIGVAVLLIGSLFPLGHHEADA